MKDVIYILFDIIVYSVQGLLLATLLKEAQPRFSFKRQYTTVGILLLQYVAVQLLLHYSDLIKSMLYGSGMVMYSSRQSIVPALAGMLITCAVSMILFRESRLKTTYYVVTFYSVMELLKFAVYPVFMWLIEKLADLNQYLFLEKQLYTEAMFYKLNLIAEFFWNVFYSSVILVFTYIIIRLIKKYLEIKESYQKSELIFVIFPGVTGLLLCLIIRSIMFYIEGYDIHLLFDSRPEMNFLIPCTSLLCIAMIIFAAKMLRKLIDESNRKIEISVYQERLREMEQHIGDIENLYAGIRGMKHDMKNYIADIKALMKENPANPPALKQYLDSLQSSVEQLDMKYNTGNPVTDVIIQRYVQLTKNSAIDFQADFVFPADMNIDAFDISIIINNALNNALEACRKQKDGRRFIELNACRQENMFFIIITNSFDGTLARSADDGRLLTTKPDSANHGLGLRNIEVCANKYYGKVETTVKDKTFELAVMLQERTSG